VIVVAAAGATAAITLKARRELSWQAA
jgi:hypothetical protein